MDSNQRSANFIVVTAHRAVHSLKFEKESDEISATGGHRILSPVDVFTSLMIFGLESKCDQYKNQDHRKGDPDFCVVTVGLEPTTPSM